MSIILYIVISSLIISLGSLIGVVTLSLNEEKLQRAIIHLVSLSAGTLLGGAFFHLLPEASKSVDIVLLLEIVVISFIYFFFIEKLLHWRHCHEGKCNIHTFGYLNLFGDGIHNFIDGLILAGTYLVDIRVGLITSLAIALHEIPQEIGDLEF